MATAQSLPASVGQSATAALASRVIRKVFHPPYANPPVSNYRKFWTSNAAAFWSSFRVQPNDGFTINQLGSNPVGTAQTAFQEVGFGYTFVTTAATEHWFDVSFQAGPLTARGAQSSIEVRLLGSSLQPARYLLPGPCSGTLTFQAELQPRTQYTLLFYSKVAIAIACGEPAKYGEAIVRFPCLVASYERPWGIEPDEPQALQAAAADAPEDAVDLERARKALQNEAEGGDTLLQPVSLEDALRAGPAGFGGFSLAQ